MYMAKLTDSEEEAIPDHNKIDSFTSEEFRIDEVNAKDQVVWMCENNMKISFILKHVSPESEVGELVSKLPDADFATISAKRLQKGSEYIPRWYLTGISEVRSAKGAEKNVFQG